MRLPDTLRNIKSLAFDTAPLIYFVEKHPKYFQPMLEIMRYIDRGQINGIISAIVLTEILVHPLRTGDLRLTKHYESILSNSNNFYYQSITPQVARQAAALRAKYNLRTPDALHIACAINAGCDALLTNDSGIKRVTEMTILLVDDLEYKNP